MTGTTRLIHKKRNGVTYGFTRRIFQTSIIYAIEGRDKAITDIKGAYLNVKIKDEVLMKITGK